MDVRCERCGTEYEFDDALVTGKGTSVKCTQCGHQFRIQGAGVDDRWIIHTKSGKTITFTSMRDLQRGIASKQVLPEDTLIRGEARRTLGAIVELMPFFEEQNRSKTVVGNPEPAPAPQPQEAAPAPAKRTSRPPPPLAKPSSTLVMERRPASEKSDRPDKEAHPAHTAPAANGSQARPSVPPPLPMRSRTATLRPAEGVAPPPMPQVRRLKDEPRIEARTPGPGHTPAPDSEAESTLRFDQTDDRPPSMSPPVPMPVPRLPPPDIDVSSPLPPPTKPRRSVAPDSDPVSSLADEMKKGRGESRRTGYVVALLLVAGIGGGGIYWTKTHPAVADAPPAGSAAALDPRVQEYLSAGERAMAEGNLELAKEKLDKASALSEKDPRVLLSVARLENARAEMPWMKLRVLPPDAKDDATLAKKDLEEATGRAKKAADDATAADASGVGPLRARVDAYRLAGDKSKAVPAAGELAAKPKDAENAFVLAMVDLIDKDNTPLPTTISRLREATEVDSSGRSRAALVYALALSGDPSAAKIELDRLAARERPHPLTSALRAFIARSPQKVALDAGALLGVDPHGLPVASTATGGGGGGGAAGGGGAGGGGGGGADVPLTGDSRALVAQGDAARNRGDIARARKAYEGALEKNPYDSEALAGLGEVSHAEHDLVTAKSEFKRAIAVNPRYLPALLGLGDVEWESGDTASGQRTYKEIVDNYPDVAYPARVKERAEQKAAPPPPVPPPTPVTASTPVTPPQPPTPPAPPTAVPEATP